MKNFEKFTDLIELIDQVELEMEEEAIALQQEFNDNAIQELINGRETDQ